MKAIIFNAFNADGLELRRLPKPEITKHQVLVRTAYAGTGQWDIYEKKGLFADSYPGKPRFPYVLGSEGSGVIEAVGSAVHGFAIGDAVLGIVTARTPKGGFYAEYVALDAHQTWHIPPGLPMDHAAALPLNGGTALRGIRDILKVQPGEKVIITGASGGIGHMAIQLAKAIGATVYAIASGADGMALALAIGADYAIDGKSPHSDTILPKQVDVILLTAYNQELAHYILNVQASRIAYPHGVQVDDTISKHALGFNAEYDNALLNDLLDYIVQKKLRIQVGEHFDLAHSNEALHSLGNHHIGRTIIAVNTD